jgi:hypothetical protein
MNPINIVTPEPAKDPKTGFLVGLDNADVNLKSKESQFFDQVKKELQGNVLTSPGNASASFRFWDGTSLALVASPNAFRYYPADGGFFLNFNQNPSFYKLNNVNTVLLRLSFLLQQKGFTFIVADTNYSVDFYLSLFAVNTDSAIQPDSFSIHRDELISVKITITHQKDGVNPTVAYSLDRRIVTLNLSNYIAIRPLIDVGGGIPAPNFNVTPEQITLRQYNNLLVQDLGIYAFFGYDFGSYNLLTGNNKLHFDELFKSRYAPYVNSTATSGGATTLTDTTQAWVTNQWTNFNLRIISGTGAGQTRIITSNTATVATISLAWTTNPNATSVYAIENPAILIPAPLQFAVDGTLTYFGQGATFASVNA